MKTNRPAVTDLKGHTRYGRALAVSVMILYASSAMTGVVQLYARLRQHQEYMHLLRLCHRIPE